MVNNLGVKNSLAMVISAVLMITGCENTTIESNMSETKPLNNDSASLFTESESIMQLEQNSRRKWDNPQIVDLDNDGYLDVIITEHAHAAKILWNDGGRYSESKLLISGDTHGIAVADYDGDGRIDIIVSQGGGGGTNPRLPIRFQVNPDRTLESLGVYSHFERSRGRAVKFVDTNNNGELDLITSAFPLKSQKQGGNFQYSKNDSNEFDFINYLPHAQWLGYKLLVADLNNDNDTDLVFYGGKNMIALLGANGLEYQNATKELFGDLTNISHTSSISAFDFDNDGDLDLLLTRAKHQFEGQTYFDDKRRRFAFFARGNKMDYEDLLIEGDLIIENLQMAYPDFSVFVGANKSKLTFGDSDKHGQKDFQLTSLEAAGFPEDTTERGLYIGYIGDGYWRIGGLTKSPTSAVIHNVKSTPKSTQQEQLPVKLLENKQGVFLDVTEQFGIDVSEQTSSAAVADFDNDGWSDILIIRNGDSSQANQQIFYKNINGKYFELTDNHGVISAELGATGQGAETFDFDDDGDMDILFGNQRGRWHLFVNNSNALSKNNFLKIRVGNSPRQNSSAQNAVLRLEACGKKFIRYVGASSAAFSQSFDTNLHIGLGSCSTIDKATITWSNGELLNLTSLTVNHSNKVGS
ncbi:CRTAC1 family protein [Aliiglaciecola sp. 3_MG-2023]|uniref:CRTAC1 family protein n=1 Tax=Aliiglaciecola sp. 3_MG-2023 TaxID=3062644 RepID=UPI0026E20E46|nr:CRTAC1 family protein [Aliiglaciecola sp. 3_MG-2023]MDO6693146.1 CRTAC1 family protein [Aliiglaciecola sp. 3_MG-2023]